VIYIFKILKKKIEEAIKKVSEKIKEAPKEEEKELERIEEVQKKEEKKLAEEEKHKEEKEFIKEHEKKEEEKPEEKQEIEKKEELIEEKKEIKKEIEKAKKILEEEKKAKIEKKIEEKEFEEILKKEKEKRGFIPIFEKEIKESDIEKFRNDIIFDLIQADVALDVAEKIFEDFKRLVIGKKVKITKVEENIKEAFKETIFNLLNLQEIDIEEIIRKNKENGKVSVIVFLGFNGSGKTTTLAKIGYMLKKKGFSVVFAAGDTFRAASIEQIQEHANRLGINLIKQKYGADSTAVIYDAVEHAKANKIDVVLADTAGRSHANINLMDELKKICRVIKPDLKVLVLDALTGNDVVEQAKRFDNAVDVDGIIFTKTDVYEKGGAIISAVYTIRKPILFLGKGQEYEDIEKFDPKKVIENIFD
jgi:fused signal recognition particle receptor